VHTPPLPVTKRHFRLCDHAGFNSFVEPSTWQKIESISISISISIGIVFFCLLYLSPNSSSSFFFISALLFAITSSS
jgi:hypothetical protein